MTERNYLWDITRLITRNEGLLTDVVYTIHYTLSVGEGAELDTSKPRAILIGACELDTTQVDPLEFVAYANLDPAQVQGWLLAALDPELQREQLAEVDARLDLLLAPKERALPWLPATPGPIEV